MVRTGRGMGLGCNGCAGGIGASGALGRCGSAGFPETGGSMVFGLLLR